MKLYAIEVTKASVVQKVVIILHKTLLKKDNRYQRDEKPNTCKRRVAIEPIIGHMKSNFRLARNFLKGVQCDEINLLMPDALMYDTAWNMKKWMVSFWLCVFYSK
jgi:IS5 family transposase